MNRMKANINGVGRNEMRKNQGKRKSVEKRIRVERTGQGGRRERESFKKDTNLKERR